jgi:hypothetical protein
VRWVSGPAHTHIQTAGAGVTAASYLQYRSQELLARAQVPDHWLPRSCLRSRARVESALHWWHGTVRAGAMRLVFNKVSGCRLQCRGERGGHARQGTSPSQWHLSPSIALIQQTPWMLSAWQPGSHVQAAASSTPLNPSCSLTHWLPGPGSTPGCQAKPGCGQGGGDHPLTSAAGVPGRMMSAEQEGWPPDVHVSRPVACRN